MKHYTTQTEILIIHNTRFISKLPLKHAQTHRHRQTDRQTDTHTHTHTHTR